MKTMWIQVAVILLGHAMVTTSSANKSESRCHGQFFPKGGMCTGKTSIHITSAVYGLTSCGGCSGYLPSCSCCPSPGDCTTPVTGTYYDKILKSCEREHGCTDLQVVRTDRICPPATDYVTLYYQCQSNRTTEKVPPTTTLTSHSSTNIPSPSNHPTTDVTFPDESPSGPTVAIVVSVLVVFLLLAAAILAAIIVIRRRRQTKAQSDNKRQPSSRHFYENEEFGKTQHHVNNGDISARAAVYSKPREPSFNAVRVMADDNDYDEVDRNSQQPLHGATGAHLQTQDHAYDSMHGSENEDEHEDDGYSSVRSKGTAPDVSNGSVAGALGMVATTPSVTSGEEASQTEGAPHIGDNVLPAKDSQQPSAQDMHDKETPITAHNNIPVDDYVSPDDVRRRKEDTRTNTTAEADLSRLSLSNDEMESWTVVNDLYTT